MPDYIPGLSDYCDRWCERCPLTSRCRSFALEQSIAGRSDEENAVFWTEFTQQREADSGVEEPPLFEDSFDDDDVGFGRAGREPLSRAAMDYAFRLRQWLSRIASNECLQPDRTKSAVEEAFEILGWYGFQIGVKLTRAMSGELALRDDSLSDVDEVEVLESATLSTVDGDEDISLAVHDAERQDRDGSAKVALIGIERSLGALTSLRRAFPSEEPAVREFYKQLSQFRIQIDRRWPNARTFHRPGFDD